MKPWDTSRDEYSSEEVLSWEVQTAEEYGDDWVISERLTETGSDGGTTLNHKPL